MVVVTRFSPSFLPHIFALARVGESLGTRLCGAAHHVYCIIIMGSEIVGLPFFEVRRFNT